jgi:hypothetical protein
MTGMRQKEFQSDTERISTMLAGSSRWFAHRFAQVDHEIQATRNANATANATAQVALFVMRIRDGTHRWYAGKPTQDLQIFGNFLQLALVSTTGCQLNHFFPLNPKSVHLIIPPTHQGDQEVGCSEKLTSS